MRHKKNTYSNFKKYLQNKLTDKERYVFEKNSNKDAFEEEALKGSLLVSKNQFIEDTEKLQQQIANKKSKKPLIVKLRKYNMAASVLVIVGMASYFYLTNRPDILEDPIHNAPIYEQPTIAPQKTIVLENETTLDVEESRKEIVIEKKRKKVEKLVMPNPKSQLETPTSVKIREAKQEKTVPHEKKHLRNKQPEPTVTSEKTKKIQGTVLDKNGAPIPGVSVVLKDSNTTEVTDFDGNFSVESDRNDTLVFHSIGFQQAIEQANDSMLVVMQEDSNSLEEVVVVGYGTMKKKKVTGAVTEVDSGDLENNMQNKAAGVSVATQKKKATPPQNNLDDFIKWIQNSFDEEKLKSDLSIHIQLKITIAPSGEITDTKIINKQKNRIKKEIKRILKTGTNWSPAIEKGVAVEETILLNFDISKEE